jgi:enoyl-CoA hydratase/carnithine racemase
VPAPYSTLALSQNEGVFTITLNRPAQQNRVNLAMAQELTSVAADLAYDDIVRVVVLRGAGDCFCAGFEGIAFDDSVPHTSQPNQTQDLINDLFNRAFQSLPQPVLASIHGQCGQAALAMLAMCDVAFAADDGVFGDCSVTAQQACDQGLITMAFPPESLDQETAKLAQEWCQKDAHTLRLAKESLRYVRDMGWEAVLAYTSGKQAELKALQANAVGSRSQAINQFLTGKSKPGLGQ